jgi:Cof subfamily protein (haloacid dehalogenase superfamily)
MYKAVFLDLDGTLLDNEKNISKENIEAIERAKAKGVLVCICSGRQIDITREYKNMAHASNYMICSNGAIIYDDDLGEELFSAYMEKDFCKEAYEYVEKNGLTIRFDTKYGRYVNNENFNTSTEILLTEGIDKFLADNEIIQMSIVGNTFEEIDKARDSLNVEGKNTSIGNRYSEEFPKHYCAFNCINDSVSKGNAIRGLCKYLKIDLKDIIAIGDESNDVSMVEVAGLGIAMENGFDDVKAVAKEITKSNVENGVAFILNKYI